MDQPTQQSKALRARLSAGLRQAMKARDQVALPALRSTLASLANAEAVGVGTATEQRTGSADIAGAALGVGATEAVRRALADREVVDLVLAEATDREEAARICDEVGHSTRATRLRAEAAVIRSYLD